MKASVEASERASERVRARQPAGQPSAGLSECVLAWPAGQTTAGLHPPANTSSWSPGQAPVGLHPPANTSFVYPSHSLTPEKVFVYYKNMFVLLGSRYLFRTPLTRIGSRTVFVTTQNGCCFLRPGDPSKKVFLRLHILFKSTNEDHE